MAIGFETLALADTNACEQTPGFRTEDLNRLAVDDTVQLFVEFEGVGWMVLNT